VAPVYDHEGKLQRAIFCIFGVPGGTCSAELRDFLNPRHDAQLQVERYGAGRVKISNKGIIEAFTRLAIGELPLMKKPQGDIAASETVGGDDDDDDDDDL
jgi:hypothetical protein